MEDNKELKSERDLIKNEYFDERKISEDFSKVHRLDQNKKGLELMPINGKRITQSDSIEVIKVNREVKNESKQSIENYQEKPWTIYLRTLRIPII